MAKARQRADREAQHLLASGTTRCSRSAAAGTSRESPSRSDARSGSRRAVVARGASRADDRARPLAWRLKRGRSRRACSRTPAAAVAALREHAAEAGAAPFDAGRRGSAPRTTCRPARSATPSSASRAASRGSVRSLKTRKPVSTPCVRPPRVTSTVCAWPPKWSLASNSVTRACRAGHAPRPARRCPSRRRRPASSGSRLRPGAPAGGGAPGREEECRRAPPGERGREEGGGEPPEDFSRQGRPAPRRKPVRRALVGPSRGFPGRRCRCFGTSSLSDAARAAEFPLTFEIRRFGASPSTSPGPRACRLARPVHHGLPPGPSDLPRQRTAHRLIAVPAFGAGRLDSVVGCKTGSATKLRPLQGKPMLYPELFKQLEAVRWNMDEDIPWAVVRRGPADRGAGADDQDERHHRMGGVAGDRDVPARQPRRQRLLRLHERLVLRGAEALAGADGVPAALPPDLVPTEAELHEVRFDFDPAPALETLMLHFCGEIRLNHWYRRAADGTPSRSSSTSTRPWPATRRATAAPTCAT